jgi:hypothetical protein
VLRVEAAEAEAAQEAGHREPLAEARPAAVHLEDVTAVEVEASQRVR